MNKCITEGKCENEQVLVVAIQNWIESSLNSNLVPGGGGSKQEAELQLKFKCKEVESNEFV